MPWSPAPWALRTSSPLVPERTSRAVSTPWAMSGDWAPMEMATPQVLPSNPICELV